MGIALLDSSVVIGFLDSDDSLHKVADAAVRDAARHHVFVVSVVTLAELLTGALLGHHDEDTVRRFFAMTVSRHIPLGEPEAERAADLRANHRSLRMPDALIAATAELNADVMITADGRLPKIAGLTCEVRLVEVVV
jgi:predicted nucleic acid-binding protein